MRILLWSALYWPNIGGEERYVQRLARGLQRLDCRVEVVTNSIEREVASEVVDGVIVSRLPIPASTHGDMDAIRAVRAGFGEIVKRLQPQLVNVHTSGPSLGHYERLRRAVPAPLVVTFHGVYPHAADQRGRISGALERGAGSIASSAATKASLINLDSIRGRNVTVALPAVDDDASPLHPYPEGPPVLVGLGRMVPEKGWDTLLHAFVRLLEICPTCRLVLIGDGTHLESLQRLANDLGVFAFVRFTGLVSDDQARTFLDKSSVVIVPSIHDEGFGMVAIEASMRARPVVASNSGGLNEAVINNVTGLLVPAGDPIALAAAILSIVDDRAMAIRLGAAGRTYAETLSVDALATKTMTVFRQALLV